MVAGTPQTFVERKLSHSTWAAVSVSRGGVPAQLQHTASRCMVNTNGRNGAQLGIYDAGYHVTAFVVTNEGHGFVHASPRLPSSSIIITHTPCLLHHCALADGLRACMPTQLGHAHPPPPAAPSTLFECRQRAAAPCLTTRYNGTPPTDSTPAQSSV